MRTLRAGEPLVDATFALDARGWRPDAPASPATHRAVAWVLAHLHRDAERCYSTHLVSAVHLVIGTSFTVEPGGRVSGARAEGPRRAPATCLERALAARTFPDPGRHQRLAVSHEFILMRRSP